MFLFIDVNDIVLDQSQFEVREWLYYGVDELLEEGYHWLEECEGFG